MNEQQRQTIKELLQKAGIDPEGQDVETAFAQMVKARIPGMSSQAQHTAFMSGFDAYCFTMQAICSGNAENEALGRKTLYQAFDVAKKATEVTEKLREVPEAATSEASEVFKRPPPEFAEAQEQQALLAELNAISDIAGLTEWYVETRARRDLVRTQSLRNKLYDAIRERRNNLTERLRISVVEGQTEE